MADLKAKQIKFPLTGTNVVSSSAQIATNISGSFTAASSSFSTRVTTAESELTNTLISSSAQIASNISGSFTAPSASFSTRVTTAESELSNTLISSSAQIATDISGSFRGELSGSHIKFVGGGVSGSLASTGSFGTIQTTTGTIPTLLGNTTFNDNLTVAGNLDIADTIYHTGDSNTKIRFPEVDTIAFNTSGLERLRITSDGQISGSSVSTGSFGKLVVGDSIDLVEDQRIFFEADKNTYIETHASDTFRVVVNNRQMFLLDEDTGNRAIFGNGTKVFIGANNNRIPTASLHIGGDIWTSGSNGHITASGNITANNFSGIFNGALSSSAQIASNISGSFTPASASFSTRITTEEGNVDTLQGRTLTAGDGLTGGGTLASDRTFAVGQGTGVTVNTNDVAIGQDVATTANVTFATITTTGNIESQGDIIAQNYIVSSSVTHMTSSFRSGSTISGDTPSDDTHQFTGSLFISGSTPNDITTKNSIFVGNHISASGNITGSQIEASGDVIAFGSSDRRLKDNITPIENPLDKMDKIGGYTFVWNNKQSTYEGKDIGVVAQEIEEVLPELVTTRGTGYKAVKYEKIVPLLIESIKELQKKVQDIEENCDCLNK